MPVNDLMAWHLVLFLCVFTFVFMLDFTDKLNENRNCSLHNYSTAIAAVVPHTRKLIIKSTAVQNAIAVLGDADKI